jgi:hypothetical protein
MKSKVFTLFLSFFVLGLLLGVLNIYFKSSGLGTIALIGVTFGVIPFILWQFLLSADIPALKLDTSSCEKLTRILFYILLFPVVDAWFVTGLNSLFSFVPTPDIGVDLALKGKYLRDIALMAVAIYAVFNVTGLSVRLFKNI